MKITEAQKKQLENAGVRINGTEIDVREYSSNPIFGNCKPGQRASGDHLHYLLHGQPETIGFYVRNDGLLALTDDDVNAAGNDVVELSLAILDNPDPDIYDVCSCGGVYRLNDMVYICDKCGAFHDDSK